MAGQPSQRWTVDLIELQTDARIANAELARRLNLSPPAIHARVKRLEDEGYVRGYIDQVTHFRTTIQQIPEVLECHHVTGEYDYLLKVAVRNRKELERLVMEKLTPILGVARIHTSLVFSEIKASTALPIDQVGSSG